MAEMEKVKLAGKITLPKFKIEQQKVKMLLIMAHMPAWTHRLSMDPCVVD